MKIGLALGSGSSRGWSHIGIIKQLSEMGIKPDIVCDTSIGALVGASYVSDHLSQLEDRVCSLDKLDLAKFFRINAGLKGFVNKDRLQKFLNEYVDCDDSNIEDYEKHFATVATNLETGKEVWLNQGSVVQAVWASISLPGLFPAIKHDDHWLVDGGLVNPVPVSVCKSMGADIVIAVNLNGDLVGKFSKKKKSSNPNKPSNIVAEKLGNLVSEYTSSVFSSSKENNDPSPSLFEAIAGSISITQDRITRSRMAGDPPDILLSPRLAHINLLEFHRAKEAIKEGQDCVKRVQAEIEYIIEKR